MLVVFGFILVLLFCFELGNKARIYFTCYIFHSNVFLSPFYCKYVDFDLT